MSDVVWQALIAALLAIYMEWSRRRSAEKVAEVAVKQDIATRAVGQVKTTLETATKQQGAQMDVVLEKVEEVHKATNSLTDRLVATTEAEALARGGIEERTRAEERTRVKEQKKEPFRPG